MRDVIGNEPHFDGMDKVFQIGSIHFHSSEECQTKKSPLPNLNCCCGQESSEGELCVGAVLPYSYYDMAF